MKEKKERTPEQKRKQAAYYRKWKKENYPDGYFPKSYSGCSMPREQYLSDLRERAYPLPPPAPLTDEQQAELDRKKEERRRKKNEQSKEYNRKQREEHSERYYAAQRIGQKRWRERNPEKAKEINRRNNAKTKEKNKNQQPNQE